MTTHYPKPNQGRDPIDGVLSAYYRAEMPNKWPAAPRPWADLAHTKLEQTASPSARSRWALAASVAMLLGGCWYLSGQMTDGHPKQSLGLEDGTASPPEIIQKNKGTFHPAPRRKHPESIPDHARRDRIASNWNDAVSVFQLRRNCHSVPPALIANGCVGQVEEDLLQSGLFDLQAG